MKYSTPEKKGISSEKILEFVKSLEDARLATHDIIIMRGDEIIYEAYWKPFHKDFLHRMYSVSKSIVSIAVGFAEQDGLLSLDDKIIKYFPEELKNQKDENMRNQTIRNMLTMSTAKPARYWFSARPLDRVSFYFENDLISSRPGGTIFDYDSEGSFVLGALVERLTKKSLKDYLNEKAFKKIGVSDEAYFLKCPGGHSWGDSAYMCTPLDILKIAKFVMNGGRHNGEQLLNEEYINEAVKKQIDNGKLNDYEYNTLGYGYLIWRTFDNSFFFNGMGAQLAVCIPDKDIVFVYNADNQGKDYSRKVIFENFFNMISRTASDEALPENPEAQRKLKEFTESLDLLCARGEGFSLAAQKISGKTYHMDKNEMGITKMRFDFSEDGGILYYTNAQGDKKLPFSMLKNTYTSFPQDGYADEVGGVESDIHYKCAVSAAWVEPSKLHIKVQIIDKYFGVLDITAGFTDDKIGIFMTKTAEDFLDEYCGFAGGTSKEQH